MHGQMSLDLDNHVLPVLENGGLLATAHKGCREQLGHFFGRFLASWMRRILQALPSGVGPSRERDRH